MDKIDKLSKLLELVQHDTVKPKDIEAFLSAIVNVVSRTKQGFETTSRENLLKISEALDTFKNEHSDVLSLIDDKSKSFLSEIENKISSIDALAKDIKNSKPSNGKDGIDGRDGMDADEDAVAEKVISKIPQYSLKGENVVSAINALSEDEDNKIDASHIKNLPSQLGNPNGGGWRNLFQLHDVSIDFDTLANADVLTYDATTRQWKNAVGGTGPGTGITSINADTTADQTIITGSSGTDFTISTTAGVTTVAIPTASASARGLLSSADWTTFNNKQSTITIGNLTDSGTDGITITGGTGAIIGTGTSISQHVADSTHNGYLSSTDWATFNGKQGTISLTTTGTSGAATLIANTLNIPNYTYTLPTASTSVLGGVKVDGTTITITGGVISAVGGGSGTVTSVTSADANATVANTTTTPVITIVSAPKWATARNLAGNSVDGSANVAFANKFIVQGTTDAGLSGAQFLGALGTGIVKNTTSTGVLSIAVAADFPTLNQNTTGSAATLTTPRAINGVNFDGSTAITVTAAAGTLTGTTLNSTVVSSSLTSVGTLSSLTVTGNITNSALTASKVVFTDASKNLTSTGIGTSSQFIKADGSLDSTSYGTGTVTAVSVASTNGFAGSSSGGTTPALTISTTITGLLKGNGTAISAAAAGTDYQAPITLTTTGTGAATFIGNVLNIPTPSAGSGTVSSSTIGRVAVYTGSTTVGGDAAFTYATGALTLGQTGGVTPGTIIMAGNTSGTQTLQPNAVASGTLTLPSGTDTIVGRASTDTLTNKRNTRRVNTTASSATPTINSDTTDLFTITALAANITSFTTNLSGTPNNGDFLQIAITDNGTARTLAWGASFEASGTLALPTTTVISTRMDVLYEWNTATSKWRILSTS